MNRITIDKLTLANVRMIFEQIIPLPDEEWDLASKFLYTKDFNKDSFLIEAGEITIQSYVIIKGIVRYFYVLDDGKEYNSSFALENSIVGSFNSMVMKEPSRFYIQALEDTQAVVLSRPNIDELYEQSQFWERFGRLAAEYGMVKKEIQEGNALDSLEVRYRKFLQMYPDINERIPQYHIASHLRVTDVALSRLRKRINMI